MKKLIVFTTCIFTLSLQAQTYKELLGKWKLVKWTQNGREKDVNSYYKTDQIYQIFKDDGQFESVIGKKVHAGKWKLSQENDRLTINSGIISVKFTIDFFDSKKRIISSDELGTLEYKKVEN